MPKIRGEPIIFLLSGVLFLPMAVAGQWFLDRRFYGYSGLLFIYSILVFTLSRIRQPVSRNNAVQIFHNKERQVLLALVGAFANLISILFFGGNRLTWYGVVLWQGGLVLFIVGIVGPNIFKTSHRRITQLDIFHWTPSSYVLGFIILIAAAFRFWEIGSLPAEPGVDLPLIFLSLEKVLNGEWPIFFTHHPGREGLFIYLASGYLRFFGSGFPALRSMGALIGTATIPAVFCLGRNMFNKEVGLLAAAFLAINRWHITLSRTGLRFILMPLFSLILVTTLEKAIESKKPFHWAMVGLVLGWGFYTYNAWMVMPAVVVCGLCIKRLVNRDWQSCDLYLLVFALLVAFMVFIPQARFAYDDPQMYSFRIASRLVSTDTSIPDSLLKIVWKNMIRTVGMFNVTGDSVAHINVPLESRLQSVIDIHLDK